MVENLIKYIRKVNIDGIEHTNSNNVILKNDISKYSSSKEPSFKLEIDGLRVKKDDKVTYECPKCHIESTIGAGRFLSKKSEYCYKCKEQNPEKRKTHSDYIKRSYSEYKKVIPLAKKEKIKFDNIDELSKYSIKLFNDESDDFKKKYYERTPSLDDFNNIKDNIISISNIEIMNKDLKYYPIIKNTNQMKYSPKVLIDNKLVLLSNCKFVCSLCDEIFVGRNIKKKSKSKLMCTSCSFSNKTFSFKTFKNIDNEKVVYQSIPELNLLKYCNKNNILVKNGPNIKYEFNGDKIYKVDFEIPKLKTLVEIKDNHIWHKRQVESGKWEAKESSARKWCRDKNYEYYLIFKTIDIINIIDNRINEKFIKGFIDFNKV
jgi:hypothetical protein